MFTLAGKGFTWKSPDTDNSHSPIVDVELAKVWSRAYFAVSCDPKYRPPELCGVKLFFLFA